MAGNEEKVSFKKLLADNIVSVLVFIASMGSMSTMLSLHEIELGELHIKIERLDAKNDELEKNKASRSDLKILDSRVRRKLDGQLKSNGNYIVDLQIKYAVMANDMNQVKSELITTWENYNRLNCE